MNEREIFMREALKEAYKAYNEGEVPVGCVIVKDGRLVSKGHNGCEAHGSPLEHAELAAIRGACSVEKTLRLDGYDLYVTLEPCPMCTGAIINSGISGVYFGAFDKDLGAAGSVLNLFEEDFGHSPFLIGGILEKECADLLTSFFKLIRERKAKDR